MRPASLKEGQSDLLRGPDFSVLDFASAASSVVDHLKVAVPMAMWSVCRFDGEDLVYLHIRDTAFGIETGSKRPWPTTLCFQTIEHAAPPVAADIRLIPQYVAAAAELPMTIGSFISVPLWWADGSLFGTLCAADPDMTTFESAQVLPLVTLLASLLSTILQQEAARVELARDRDASVVLSETDALTGLFNRRAWLRFLDHEERRSQRFADPAAVIIIDLDGLKTVNDTQGHHAGDALLTRAATVLRQASRESDILARLGGDEFGVLAVRSGEQAAKALVTRLRTELASAGVPASLGCARCAMDESFTDTWRRADTAMYADKQRLG